MQRAQILARFVLFCFALNLGLSVASPVLKPQGTQFVCSGSGVIKLISSTSDDAQDVNSGMDCPLCASALCMPPLASTPFHSLAPLFSLAPSSQTEVRLFQIDGNQPPARGPPAAH